MSSISRGGGAGRLLAAGAGLGLLAALDVEAAGLDVGARQRPVGGRRAGVDVASAGGSLTVSSCLRRSRMTADAAASPASVEASMSRVMPRPWRSMMPGSTARS